MRKCSFIIVLVVLLGSSVVLPQFAAAQDDVVPFIVATDNGPGKLDPVAAYDSESIQTIMQVVEGLYRYNYSSPEMESIPCLAATV